jgi:5-methylthioadenosine/S-adenosylhomocysteine deaminase
MSKRLLIIFVAMILLNTQTSNVAAKSRRQRAERVDLLILGGTIVTMDTSRRVIEDGGIAVSGGRIVAVGPRNEILSKYSGRQTLDSSGRVITPVLINFHTHIPMVLFR